MSSKEKITLILSLLALLVVVSCASGRGERDHAATVADEPEQPRIIEAVSLRGGPLFRQQFDPERRDRLERDLAEARARFREDPTNEDNIIWYGRRLGYLGRYIDALDVYTRGILQDLETIRLRRHAGHRLITVRRLDDGILDLTRAAELAEHVSDAIEPDGRPNALNQPRSTTKFNIWYHLGLAHFLKGDFPEALHAYQECMRYSRNDDLLVATSHWMYMTLRRLGRDRAAARLLEPIRAEMEIIENDAYHRLLMMYKGEIDRQALLAGASGDNLAFATIGFGVGHWYLMEGRVDEAVALFERVADHTNWAAFGHIAAEAELARAGL